jgi:hypothetical protein
MNAIVMSIWTAYITCSVNSAHVYKFVKQFVDILQLQGHILALRNRENWPTIMQKMIYILIDSVLYLYNSI